MLEPLGIVKDCPSLLLSLLPWCQSIWDPLSTALPSIFPVRGNVSARRDLWVTRGGLKCKRKKEGIWDAAHMWVWITPSFFPLQERSPSPPRHRDVIWPYPGGKPGCNQINRKLQGIFNLSVNGFRQMWASAPLLVAVWRWRGTRHVSRAITGSVQSAAITQQELSTVLPLPSSLTPETHARTPVKYPGASRA